MQARLRSRVLRLRLSQVADCRKCYRTPAEIEKRHHLQCRCLCCFTELHFRRGTRRRRGRGERRTCENERQSAENRQQGIPDYHANCWKLFLTRIAIQFQKNVLTHFSTIFLSSLRRAIFDPLMRTTAKEAYHQLGA